MVKKAGTGGQALKREKRRPMDEDYLVINLSMLTRFRLFVNEVLHAEGPVSFRSFMKNRGSHRTMALTVDTIERFSKQLLLRREILGADGKATGRYLGEYEGVEKVQTRRTSGVSPRDITAHGRAWADLSMLVDDLFDLVLDEAADPHKVSRELRELRDQLTRARGTKN